MATGRKLMILQLSAIICVLIAVFVIINKYEILDFLTQPTSTQAIDNNLPDDTTKLREREAEQTPTVITEQASSAASEDKPVSYTVQPVSANESVTDIPDQASPAASEDISISNPEQVQERDMPPFIPDSEYPCIGSYVVFEMGSEICNINGSEVLLNITPYAEDYEVYLPLGATAPVFGWQYTIEEDTIRLQKDACVKEIDESGYTVHFEGGSVTYNLPIKINEGEVMVPWIKNLLDCQDDNKTLYFYTTSSGLITMYEIAED